MGQFGSHTPHTRVPGALYRSSMWSPVGSVHLTGCNTRFGTRIARSHPPAQATHQNSLSCRTVTSAT